MSGRPKSGPDWHGDYLMPRRPYAEMVRPIYRGLCGGQCPPEKLLAVEPSQLGDAVHELQDWCSIHLGPGLEWMTGLSVIEAVELAIDGAVENDNVRRPDDLRSCGGEP